MRMLLPLTLLLLFAALPSPAQTGVSLVLGRPAADQIAVNVLPAAGLEFYLEYGSESGNYTAQTEPQRTEAGVPAEVVLTGLTPDQRHFYRLRFRSPDSEAPFDAGEERSFHTARSPGSSFLFCLQGDSHPEREKTMFHPDLYRLTLAAVAAEQPDFHLLLGDDFSVDTLPEVNAQTVAGRYTLQLGYLSELAHSTPLFLVNGNHEQAARYLLDGTPDNVAVWAQNARNRYFPQPAPDTFYTGNPEEVEHIGLLRNYYAWQWGDALFVVIDPYWGSPVAVDNVFGNTAKGQGANGKTADKWRITHGDAQYAWLKQTLEESTAKWKFVFAHHVLGTGRGGIEEAGLFEWGGSNDKGVYQFPDKRPAWPSPIHQLLVSTGVNVFFHGHDHLFAHQELDGVVYQEVPCPADNTYTAFNADAYRTGDVFPNAGYLRVSVNGEAVTVDYVRQYLAQDEQPPDQVSGAVQFSYTLGRAGAVSAVRQQAVRKR